MIDIRNGWYSLQRRTQLIVLGIIPAVIGYSLRNDYSILAAIQFGLAAVLFLTAAATPLNETPTDLRSQR